VQDCHQAGNIPIHEYFNVDALHETMSHSQIRESYIDLVATNTKKAADPGNFKDERKWPEWEKLFVNYLLVIPGWRQQDPIVICCVQE
jgi:hypothetical protein